MSSPYPTKREIKFSCLLPVHNEEKFLPYSLPSTFALEPDQIVIVLDRCSDNSLGVILELKRLFNYKREIDIITTKKSKGWNRQTAYVFYEGMKNTRNDIILRINADTQFGTEIGEYMSLFEDKRIGWISFSYRDYPFKYSSWLTGRIQKIYTKRIPRGINHAFRKSIMIGEVDKMRLGAGRGIDSLIFNESIRKGYQNLFLSSDTVHLRPRGMKRDYKKGVGKWFFSRVSLTEILFNSILYFRPLQIAGYLKARMM